MASMAVEDPEALKKRAEGAFVRAVSQLRSVLEPEGEFAPEPNRYHLYAAFNCPWCHRVVLARAMLGLESTVSLDVCFPTRTSEKDAKGREGLWAFKPEGMQTPNGAFARFPECTADTVNGRSTVAEIYEADRSSNEGGRFSVPILYDKKTKRIVNNESSEIVRMFNEHARALRGDDGAAPALDLYPPQLRGQIDQINVWVYNDINNGSYKAGFASSQAHYEAAYHTYFAALAKLDGILATSKFLCSQDQPTEADLRLLPTLYRHDAIYHARFKLNASFLGAYTHVSRWLRTMFTEVPGVRVSSGVNYMRHCKQGYFGRSGSNTIPIGPPGYPECFWN